MIITAYAPAPNNDDDCKEHFYSKLQETLTRMKHRGTVVLLGDFNARIYKATTEAEASIIANWTFDRNNANPLDRNQESVDNRTLLINFCLSNDLIIANTFFQKQEHKLATYWEKGITLGDPVIRGNFEQIDFALVPRRWRNSV